MTWLKLLEQQRIIAVIRADNFKVAYNTAIAAAKGGIKLIEITWNTVEVETLIPQLHQELPDCTIGSGTILDAEMAKQAIACGSQFLFTPHTSVELISTIRSKYSDTIPIIPGALTPTEILTAWQTGATAVKVFPIKVMGGVEYLNCLRPVLEHIPLIPTGGVTSDNTIQFLEAGAIAVGLSSQLFSEMAIINQDWQTITERCANLVQQIQEFNSDRSLNS